MYNTTYIMTTNANNTENIILVNAEPVVTAVEFNMEDLLPVTIADLIYEDFGDDDEAEFLQGVLEIQEEIEDIILSDHPENFLLPTANDLPPALLLLEKIEELKNYKFGNRTLARMERRIRGENLLVEAKLTQLEKSVHPAYMNWCCPKCLDYYKGARCLKQHMERTICKDRHTRLVVKATETKIVKAKFYQITAALTPLVQRAEDNKKLIQSELEEEDYQEEETEEIPWCYEDNKNAVCNCPQPCNPPSDSEEEDEEEEVEDVEELPPLYQRCNPPCPKRRMIGMSWWKQLGYPQPCGCAQVDFDALTEEEQDQII